MAWKQAAFDIAHDDGIIRVRGSVRNGVGLHWAREHPDRHVWSLTHLNSGHCIATLLGERKAILPIATEVADACDWSFTGIAAGEAREFRDKIAAIVERDNRAFGFLGSGTGSHDASVADEIACRRAA